MVVDVLEAAAAGVADEFACLRDLYAGDADALDPMSENCRATSATSGASPRHTRQTRHHGAQSHGTCDDGLPPGAGKDQRCHDHRDGGRGQTTPPRTPPRQVRTFVGFAVATTNNPIPKASSRANVEPLPPIQLME